MPYLKTSQVREIRRLRTQGLSYRQISIRTEVSISSARLHSLDIPVPPRATRQSRIIALYRSGLWPKEIAEKLQKHPGYINNVLWRACRAGLLSRRKPFQHNSRQITP